MVGWVICILASLALIYGSKLWLKTLPPPPAIDRGRKVVCSACGRIRGQHGGWDESCFLHAVEVWEDSIDTDNSGRVVSAVATRRELSLSERD